MTQLSLIPLRKVYRFDGATIEAQDSKRLASQLERVRTVMSDGQWHTIPELARKAIGSEAAVSARLRDLRKVRFGSCNVERRRITGGLFEYRIPA